jgi:hypothetical protein
MVTIEYRIYHAMFKGYEENIFFFNVILKYLLATTYKGPPITLYEQPSSRYTTL